MDVPTWNYEENRKRVQSVAIFIWVDLIYQQHKEDETISNIPYFISNIRTK